MTAKIRIRCGAPLTGLKCEYCGAEYNGSQFFGDLNSYSGEIIVNGENIKCYIGEINTAPVMSPGSGRTANGELVCKPVAIKRKITLIEY